MRISDCSSDVCSSDLPGAWLSDLLLTIAGPLFARVLPIGPIIASRLWRGRPIGPWRRMVRGTIGGVALMAIAVGFVFGSSRMWLPAGWGGVIGLGVSGCAGWALAYIGDAAIRDWATGLLAAVAGVSGLVIWIRSLDLDLAEDRKSVV